MRAKNGISEARRASVGVLQRKELLFFVFGEVPDRRYNVASMGWPAVIWISHGV